MGPTLRQEGDYYGAVVNLAARATKVAPIGNMVVSETLRRELADANAFSFKEIGPLHLKGFADPVTLYSLQRGDGAIDVA